MKEPNDPRFLGQNGAAYLSIQTSKPVFSPMVPQYKNEDGTYGTIADGKPHCIPRLGLPPVIQTKIT